MGLRGAMRFAPDAPAVNAGTWSVRTTSCSIKTWCRKRRPPVCNPPRRSLKNDRTSPFPTCTFQLTNTMSSNATASGTPAAATVCVIGPPTPAHHESSRARSRASSGPNHCSTDVRHEPAETGVIAGGVQRTQPLNRNTRKGRTTGYRPTDTIIRSLSPDADSQQDTFV